MASVNCYVGIRKTKGLEICNGSAPGGVPAKIVGIIIKSQEEFLELAIYGSVGDVARRETGRFVDVPSWEDERLVKNCLGHVVGPIEQFHVGQVVHGDSPRAKGRRRVVADEAQGRFSTFLVFPGRKVEEEVGNGNREVFAGEAQKFADAATRFV
jgi:hypothetical protein